MTTTILCCDIGGSSLRVGLLDETGCIRSQAARALPVPRGSDGQSEIDPGQWWGSFLDLAAALDRDDSSLFSTVAGIAICGMTRTQVLVGSDGDPVRPAISWLDSRARDEAGRLAAAHGGESIDAYHPAARLAWVARHEPGIFAAARSVIEPKDYLALRLTGRSASDPISLARLLAFAGGDGPSSRFKHLLPELIEPTAVIGPVAPSLPSPLGHLAGRPVFMASHDTWAAVLGLGALSSGSAYNIVGTSDVLGLIAPRAASAPGLMSVDWGQGLHQIGGPSQNGAAVVQWLTRICGSGAADGAAGLSAMLAGERHPQPALFLPFLRGERVPYWDPDLRGAFLGLSESHEPTDLAWAVLEGAAFAARFVLEAAEAATGEQARDVRLGGGGARNEAWAQIRADVMRRPVVIGFCDEPGLLGCAAVAWTGLGRFASLGDAQRALVQVSKRFEPRPARSAEYDRLYPIYREAVSATTPIAHTLAHLRFDTSLARGAMP